jgi:hypothetical protein
MTEPTYNNNIIFQSNPPLPCSLVLQECVGQNYRTNDGQTSPTSDLSPAAPLFDDSPLWGFMTT